MKPRCSRSQCTIFFPAQLGPFIGKLHTRSIWVISYDGQQKAIVFKNRCLPTLVGYDPLYIFDYKLAINHYIPNELVMIFYDSPFFTWSLGRGKGEKGKGRGKGARSNSYQLSPDVAVQPLVEMPQETEFDSAHRVGVLHHQ